MQDFDVQTVEIEAPFDVAFRYIADPGTLPEWTHAFRSVSDGRAILVTPEGAVDIGLEVRASREAGTVDWTMTFPDGSVAQAFSRLVERGVVASTAAPWGCCGASTARTGSRTSWEKSSRWRGRRLAGVEARASQAPGVTPALIVRVPGAAPGRVLLYGHLDKQPEFEGWEPGLGPWTPVRRDGRLYGRGAVDDGYALCAALGALESLQSQGRPHPTCVLLLECGEESGSTDLPEHLAGLAPVLGTPDLVVALDSEAGDFARLWTTTSLRGVIMATLRVRVLTEGVHSGAAGGLVPGSFRILRRLLDRIEDAETGRLASLLDSPIPEPVHAQAKRTAAVLGATVVDKFPWHLGTVPVDPDPATLLVNNTWRGCLSVTGAEGLPALAAASNTHLPAVALKLSIRVPPTVSAAEAAHRLKETLESEPPYGAEVTCSLDAFADGWAAATPPAWLAEAIDEASQRAFGQPAASLGTGGTIPFVEMLGSRFPRAAFLVTGVAGPQSNAHGPNEFLDLVAARHLTACLADVLDAAGRCLSRER